MIQTAYVNVNITSPSQIVKVEVYFRGAPPTTANQQPHNLSAYSTGFMYTSESHGNSSLWVYQLPRYPNDTMVYAFVEVTSTNGEITWSPGMGYPAPTCEFMSPPPAARLQLWASIEDINQRYLNLTAAFSANLYNSETFEPISLLTSGGLSASYIYLNQGSDDYWYTKSLTYGFAYYSGIAQSFPLDSYQYAVTFALEGSLNYSTVQLNQVTLPPGTIVPNVVNYSSNINLEQSFDENAWTLSSSATFSQGSGLNHPSTIAINLQLSRKISQVADPILIPIFALYALLGMSVLLRGKDDLANRLLVYISILLFSYGLLASINSVVMAPFAISPNMAQLLALALTPCTAILAGASIVRWTSEVGKRAWLPEIVDLIGVVFALAALLAVAQFDVPQYVIVSNVYHLVHVPYTLADYSWFGDAIIVAFASGGVVLSLMQLRKLTKSQSSLSQKNLRDLNDPSTPN